MVFIHIQYLVKLILNAVWALASSLIVGGDVSVLVRPPAFKRVWATPDMQPKPAQLRPEWSPLLLFCLQIEELRAVGEEKLKRMRDGKPQVRPESIKCDSSLISSIITRWQLSFSLLYICMFMRVCLCRTLFRLLLTHSCADKAARG